MVQRLVLLLLLALLHCPSVLAQERCEPACENMQCGDDGCGGVCGECEEGMECVLAEDGGAMCASICVPFCENKSCGDDGCGGDCGTCSEGQECVESESGVLECSEVCEPNCDGKNCGGDGCGGVCGTCEADYACVDSVCVEASCAGFCGESPEEKDCHCDASCYTFGDCCADVCATCGICGGEEVAEVSDCNQGSCVGCCGVYQTGAECQCDASCAEYGDCCDDACDVCGLCGDSVDTPCPDWLTYEGCCSGDASISYCRSTGLQQGGPCPDGLICGWNDESGYFDCVVEPGVPPAEHPILCTDLAGTEWPDTESPGEDDALTAEEETDGVEVPEADASGAPSTEDSSDIDGDTGLQENQSSSESMAPREDSSDRMGVEGDGQASDGPSESLRSSGGGGCAQRDPEGHLFFALLLALTGGIFLFGWARRTSRW